MASYKRRQSSDYNQSVPETEFIPEAHAYQEKHYQPTLNQPVSETHAETEYGSTVTPDTVESRADKNPRSTVMEKSDQPGELDLASGQVEQDVQGNSDPGTQYSTPDVSSGVSSGPGGFTAYGGGAAAAGSTTATTVVASTTAASITSVAVTTVGAVVVAATIILPLIIGVPSAIIFDDISVTDTTIYYSIYFEDYEEDMDLTVSLHNNFTDRSHKVESEYFSMMEKDLRPGMDYKLTVYSSMGTVLEEKTIRTESSPPYPTSVEVSKIDVTNTTASYSILFNGYRDGMELTVSIHNGSMVRNHTVESESVSYTEEGLDPDTEYWLTIYGKDDAVLYESSFRTLDYPPPKLNVSAAEFSTTDGLIHLSATLEDEKGVCSGFRAIFYDETDGKHIPVRTVDISGFDSEITMDAGLASGTSIEGSFTVECTIAGENTVMYSTEMTAYGAPYFDFTGRATITGDTATVGLIIVDPAGVRTDYHWMFYTQEDTDTSLNFTDTGELTGSSFTVTGVPTYDHQSFFIKVSWEESGMGDLRTLEYKTYESPVTVDTAGMWLVDMGGSSFALEVPVTVNDPGGVWTELELVLGDTSYSSTTYGYSSVIAFSSSDTLITIPVTDAGLYGKTVPLSVRNGPSVVIDTFPAFVAGPTMTVGHASMNKVNVTIGGDTYETRFDVEISDLVDDLHYLTDSSGTWTVMPVLEASTEDMTALSVTPTGEGSYIASFYYNNWNAAMMYCVSDNFTVAGVSKSFSMVYVNEQVGETYTTRSSSGDIMAYVTVVSSGTVTNAIAVSGSTEITGTVTPVYENYQIALNLTTADPYAEYTIYLYNGSTEFDSFLKVTFPYPRLIEGSAVYHTSTGKATVQFEYDRSPIYMPDYFVSGDTDIDGILTLTFDVDASSPVLTGESYFRFIQSDKNPNYYWYTTFRIES